ncbi:MAG: phosphatase PAP2 family protein [Myxococcales bacterium]|nr:phosphatase PAP2 family protein [Myxococcales bacterium]MCB9544875.1 phosphatase PAP2 family protein [Myxococcales bacterium]
MPASDRRPALRAIGGNLAAGLAFTAVAYLGFQLVARHTDPATAHRLDTAVDRALPFWPWSVFLYSWVYTSMLYPAFVIRSARLFRRVVAAYGVTVAVSLVLFAVFPVTSEGFRPDIAGLDVARFDEWGVRLTFFVDPPTNLFPSLHLAAAVVAAASAWAARRLYGVLALTFVLAVGVSILTMKQHYVADGVAALVVGLGAWWLCLRPYQRDPEPAGVRAIGPGAVVAYAVFHASVYGALYLAFRAGFAPWAG